MKRIVLLLIIIGIGIGAYAQNGAGVVLINKAVGPGFSINRDGKQEYIPVGGNSNIGYRLQQGDIVNVEGGTFLELLCLPSNALIYVAELSSFSVARVGANGTIRIALYYGRIKANINDSGSKSGIEISGPEANALTDSSEFGYDFVYNKDGKLLNRIYCIRGNLTVAENLSDDKNKSLGRTASLKAKEMVAITGVFAEGQFEKKFFEDDILQYWKENNVEARLKSLAAVDANGKSEPVVKKAREENSEQTLDKLLNREEESKEKEGAEGTDKTAKAAEGREKPAQDQGNGKGMHFALDLGIEVAFLVYGTELDTGGLFDFMRMAGMDWLVDMLNFIFKARAVTYLDGTLMFNDFIGVGIETGLGYNTLMVGNTTYHFFGIPAYLFVRSNISILYLQLFGGVNFVGTVEEGNFGSMQVNTELDVGLRAGINLGGMALYATAILSSPDFDGFFNNSFDFRIGAGLKFNLGNF